MRFELRPATETEMSCGPAGSGGISTTAELSVYEVATLGIVSNITVPT